jgi:hypothetical protein
LLFVFLNIPVEQADCGGIEAAGINAGALGKARTTGFDNRLCRRAIDPGAGTDM